MYIIQEMQSDGNGNVAFVPPVVRATRNEADSEYHLKAGYAAISAVPIHTVMCYTEEGIQVLPPVVYKHITALAPDETDEEVPESTPVDTTSGESDQGDE